MPRKTVQNRKGGSRSAKKDTSTEDVKAEQDAPSRKPSLSKEDSKEGERERSRRSSTAAQTAASVAESRVTRTRTSKRDSTSPSDSRRASGKDVELPAARVRSSRRNAGRVNYKESDGEEEASTPKNEDVFDSNDEFEDSDSDEKSKPKAKRPLKSPPKPRASAARQKGKGKSRAGGRGRPTKRKNRADEEEEEEEEEDQDAVSISDDNADALDESSEGKKTKTESREEEKEDSGTGRKRSRIAAKPDPVDKPSRKSSRGSTSRPSKLESPVSRRPSRNKQVKKYTEVDEDFDEEGKSEPEEEKEEEEEKAKVEPEVLEVTRKRKREPDSEPNKRPKKEENQEVLQSSEAPEASLPPADTKEPTKPTGDIKNVKVIDDESSDEPMEVEEIASEDEPEKAGDEKPTADVKDKQPAEESKVTEKIEEPEVLHNSKDLNHPSKVEEHPVESNHQNEATDDVSNANKSVEVEKVSENKDTTPVATKSPEKEHLHPVISEEKKDDARNSVNCVQSSLNQSSSLQENTFLSKEPVTNTSINGESGVAVKSDVPVPLDKNTSFHYQNSSALKANGDHSDTKQKSPSQQTSLYSGREYVTNKSLGIDLMKGLKGNPLRFGFASYNLSSTTIHKDKLVHELDTEVSIICLQNVAKSLFDDLLESHFDALGFKAVVSWMKDGVIGLATFYKTSVFKLHKSVETPVQKLVQKKLESSTLEEGEKSAVSECFDKCGNVLLTQLECVQDEKVALTVANVKIPSSTVSLHALQVTCVNQELASLSEQNDKRVLLCGEFNVLESEVPYQLLRHGRLSEQILDDLKAKTDSAQSTAVVKLLRNISHHPSLKLCSCYALVLGKELMIPESKVTSPDLLWVSAEGVHTVGVVDLPQNYTERLSQGQVPLKADVAVALPFPPKPSV